MSELPLLARSLVSPIFRKGSSCLRTFVLNQRSMSLEIVPVPISPRR